MADTLVAALTADPLPDDVEQLYLTDPLGPLGDVDGVMFSGGVAEYVYDRESQPFGDLGGAARPRAPPADRLRRAALPAAARRASASAPPRWARRSTACSSAATPAGSPTPTPCSPAATCRCCEPVYELGDDVDAEAVAAADPPAPRRPGRRRTPTPTSRWRCRWSGLPTLRAAVPVRLRHPRRAGRPHRPGPAGLRDARRRRRHDPGPAAARRAGRDRPACSSSTAWRLRDFDYIDIGRVRHPSRTVPVTIKSLVFEADPHHSQVAAS